MTRRRPRPDPIVTPDAWAVKDAITLSAAVRPLDEATARMEDKWGVDRLPGLVPPDLAAKWGRTVEAFERAMEAMDVDAVVDLSARLIRGMAALDRAATEAGHSPLPATHWPAEIDGRRVLVVRHREAVSAVASDLEVWTFEEVCNLATAGARAVRDHPKVAAALDTFTGATVGTVRPLTERVLKRELDDEIPF